MNKKVFFKQTVTQLFGQKGMQLHFGSVAGVCQEEVAVVQTYNDNGLKKPQSDLLGKKELDPPNVVRFSIATTR